MASDCIRKQIVCPPLSVFVAQQPSQRCPTTHAHGVIQVEGERNQNQRVSMAAVLDVLQRNTEQGFHNFSHFPVKAGGGGTSSTTSNSIYSPVVVAQYHHVREFHKLMVQWVAEPNNFPFASHWVAALTNIEGVEERTAHRMLVEQVDRAHQHYPTLFQMPKGAPSKSREVSLRIGSVTNTTSELPSDSAQLEEALVTHLSATYLCMRTLLSSAASAGTTVNGGGKEGAHRPSTMATAAGQWNGAIAVESQASHVQRANNNGPVDDVGYAEDGASGGEMYIAAVKHLVHSVTDDAMIAAAVGPLALQPTPVDLLGGGGAGLVKPPTAPKRQLHSAPSGTIRRSLVGAGDTALLAKSHVMVDMNIARSVCRPGGNSARTGAPPIVEVVQQVLSAHQDLAAAAAQEQQAQGFKPNTQAIESMFSVERMKEIRQRLELQALQQQRQNDLIDSLRSPRFSMREVRSGGPLATAAATATASAGQVAVPPPSSSSSSMVAGVGGGSRVATRPHTARAALASQSAQQRRLVLGSASTRAQVATGTVEPVVARGDGGAAEGGGAASTAAPPQGPRPVVVQGPKSVWASRILLPMSTTSHQTAPSIGATL